MTNSENEGLANMPPAASALGSGQALTTAEQLTLALLTDTPVGLAGEIKLRFDSTSMSYVLAEEKLE